MFTCLDSQGEIARVGIMRWTRGRLAELGVSQQALADVLGIHPTALNHILKGRRRPGPDFEARVKAALALLERAERAAQDARQRVLAS